MKRKSGFTLVEMLVVICIILILMSLLAVLIKHVINRARYKATGAIVHSLKTSCENYKVDEMTYPPASPPGSKNLHLYLGRELVVMMGVNNSGGGGIPTKKPPYIGFKTNWLEGNPPSGEPGASPRNIIDAWDQVVDYYNPKPNGPATPPSFWIRAFAKDPADSAAWVTSDLREE